MSAVLDACKEKNISILRQLPIPYNVEFQHPVALIYYFTHLFQSLMQPFFCGLVVRVPGYRFTGPGSILGIT
jgi:hypothetical protein